MPGPLSSLAAELRTALACFDPAGSSPAECAALVEELAVTEKACAAARVRAAVRAASGGAHREAGFRDAADWMAVVSGSSAGAAKAALSTAAALDACPRTRDAVVAGELSLAQAREITGAEVERPGSEAELVALAKRSTLQALRDEARRVRFAAVDVEVLHARQHAAREVRHWRDELGMVCGRFALPPEVGVPFVNGLDRLTDRLRRRARSAGSVEPREAHAADAFAALVGVGGDGTGRVARAERPGRDDVEIALHGRGESTDPRRRSRDDATDAGRPGRDDATDPGRPGRDDATGDDTDADRRSRDDPTQVDAGPGGRRRRRSGAADLVVVCDLRAWRRGHAHGGETCHIVGGTPVPVAVARDLAADAFVKAVLHDGKRIDTVVHWGRHIPAEVRTALELGAPPAFEGAVCVEPGCGRRHGLEWDHVNPVANHGPTSYANLAARCWPHHHDKTDRDRAAGRLGRRSGHSPPGADPP